MSPLPRPTALFEPPRSLRRRAVPWILTTALLVLAAMSATQIFVLRQELRAQVVSQLEAQLKDRVDVWEEQIVARLDDALDQALTGPDETWRIEQRLQARDQWLDAVYVWRPQQLTPVLGKLRVQPPSLLFPSAPFDENQVTRAACVQSVTVEDPVARANAYLSQCRREPLAVRMYASSEAAVLFAGENDLESALRALDQSGFDPQTPLDLGIHELGLDPHRMVVQRLQRADYLIQSHKTDEGLDLYASTAVEITRLDAPELTTLLTWVRTTALPELRKNRRDDVSRLIEEGVARAERRKQAIEEIKQRILPLPPQLPGESPRFSFDQYRAVPFLLYYGYRADGFRGAAIQVDQPLLLDDFATSTRRHRSDLVITDTAGSLVVGTPSPHAIEIEVPFLRTLPHLRVGLHASAVDARMERLDNQWLVPLVIIAFCVILGFIALIAQIRADRRLQQLLVRQREFTARVTHELKTPLAGIRVMAENLEAGAFESTEDQRAMARSIVRESDRLATRVDEILAVARERRIPDPEPFDPEEVALEVIDHWGPRLEQAGVRLHADLHATDALLGDAAALRDALSCLLDNALKYRNDQRSDSAVWLNLTQEGDEVAFEVLDNGIGVPPDMRTAIFDRFVRVEGPNRGRAGGHGLGLAQVAEIVRSHRGSVVCSEGIEGGARFLMKIPAYRT